MIQRKEAFLRIDAHVHSAGVSICAKKSVEEVIQQKIEEGYDGAILTNHCQPWYYVPHQAEHEAYIRSVKEEFARGKAYAQERGFQLLLGLEITLLNPFYSDWLLYGVNERFLDECPVLYMLSQRELFALCEKYGILMLQAHPFRANNGLPSKGVGEVEFLHGIEINCSMGDLPYVQKILDVAKEQGKIVTCGTDFHGKPSRGYALGGMFVPVDVKTSVDFANYLKETNQTELFLDNKIIKSSFSL